MKKAKQIQKDFEREKILNKLAQPGVNDFVMVLDGLKPDFNVGKIFRSADAMGANSVHLVNIPFFSPGTAMGSFRHVQAVFHETFADCYKVLHPQGYQFYVMEPAKGDDLHKVQLPKKTAFVMGHEEYGISFKPQDFENVHPMKIPQFGKVQSMNVSIAASVVMYEYLRQRVLV